MTSSDRIKRKAIALGFDRVGVSSAVPLREEGELLREWLARGYQASMDWMSRNAVKRTDPGLVVRNARSVISLAVNYQTDHTHSVERGRGKVSRYAWGDDYHDVVGSKLKDLSSWLTEEFPEGEHRYYVDTGPVMEKVWAERAGIGWIGKHTNLITRDLGSWVFLAAVITTLELESDLSETDHCGSCTLCLEACPTGAIVEPYVVDSNRCISYLTIEHRGDLDPEIPLDGWIYGCDVCQDVCPWNEKFARTAEDPAFRPREWNREPVLADLVSMSSGEFSRKFRGSPIKRTRHKGFMRNVQTVIMQMSGENDPTGSLSSSKM